MVNLILVVNTAPETKDKEEKKDKNCDNVTVDTQKKF